MKTLKDILFLSCLAMTCRRKDLTARFYHFFTFFFFFYKLLLLPWAANVKLNNLVLIGRLMHYKFILTLILEKLLCLLRDFNQFHDEGYVKISVSESRLNFFSYMLKFCLINIFKLLLHLLILCSYFQKY